MTGNIKKQDGYTLVEILVATTLFLLIFILIIDIAVIFTRDPQKIIRQKKLETELEYAVEQISREIRIDTIDYNYSFNTPDDDIYLLRRDLNQTHILHDSINKKVKIEALENGIIVAEEYATTEKIEVTDLKFYIRPISEPFCDYFETGAYQECSSDVQPRVTFSITARHADDYNIQTTLQTTASSRIYKR